MKRLVLAATVLIFLASASGFSFGNKGKAAVIDLSGTITPSGSSGLSFSSGITPEQVRELNSQAVKQGADAIIYEINSGGGAVVASKEIYRSIDGVEIPTVCRMRDVAASGGYLISLGCDRIVADSSTLTGSIGVKSSYIQFEETLDKIGADYVNISAGKLKEIGNPYMNASETEKQILEDKVETIQKDFLEKVRSERNLSKQEVEEVESGVPFLGSEAKNLSLVDSLGGRREALETAENLSDKELSTFEVQTTPGFSIFSLLNSEISLSNIFGSSSPFRAAIAY